MRLTGKQSAQQPERSSSGFAVRTLLLLIFLTGTAVAEARPPAPARPAAAPKPLPPKTLPPKQLPVKKTAAVPQKPMPASVQRAPARATASSTASRAAQANTDLLWTRSLPNWIYTLQVTTSRGLKLGDSHALAVDSTHFIAPSGFVLDAELVRPDLKLIIGGQYPARIVDLDLANQVVVLQSTSPVASWLPAERLRSASPQIGEMLIATEGQGIFRSGIRSLGLLRALGTNRTLIDLGNAPAVSGQFLFDRNGSFVSILPFVGTDKTAAQTSWTPSNIAISDLIRRRGSPRPASESAWSFTDEKKRQLTSWQANWMTSLSRFTSPNASNTDELECEPFTTSVEDQGLAAKLRSIDTVRCTSRVSLSLGAGYSAGFEVLTASVKLRVPASAVDRASLAREFASSVFSKHRQTASVVDLMTPSKCEDATSLGAHGKLAAVRFCTAALKEELNLNDTVFSVVSEVSDGSWVATAVHLRGFDQMNSKAALAALLKSSEASK